MSGLEVALALGAVSTIVGTVGQIQQGIAQRSAAKAQIRLGEHQRLVAERQAEAFEIEAGQKRAIGQRNAAELRRQGRLVLSRGQAVAAASGAGALDPTVIGLLGDVDREVEIRALNAMFEGEEAGRGLEFGAALERAGGEGQLFASRAEAQASRARATNSFLAAGGTILSGGSSLFLKYSDRGGIGKATGTSIIPDAFRPTAPIPRRRPLFP